MAELIPQPVRLSFEDAAQLDPDEFSGELVNGEWVPVTRSTIRHGEVAVNVSTAFKLYARKHREWGVASNDPGTKLTHAPDTLRGPDVALYHRERRPTGKGAQGWMEGSPEVVVEVRSDSESMTSLLRKTHEYFRSGALLVLLLDPDSEELIVARPPDHFSVLTTADTFEAEDVLPEFTCPVSELFE
jgi:Uma2 family endonuclease